MRGLLSTHGKEGVKGQETLANAKAKIIYDLLDAHSDVYSVVTEKAVRSRMNICFRIRGGDAAQEKVFLEYAEAQMLQGLKGHRSVGGIRVSNYNAVPLANVTKLATYLEDFANKSKHG